jgi:hypothetical protein
MWRGGGAVQSDYKDKSRCDFGAHKRMKYRWWKVVGRRRYTSKPATPTTPNLTDKLWIYSEKLKEKQRTLIPHKSPEILGGHLMSGRRWE